MKGLLLGTLALGLCFTGTLALAEVPVTATVVNCEIQVRATNGPVDRLVDLTVIRSSGPGAMRHTEKVRTNASGTASATVKLRQLFPGQDVNGQWGVSVDIGVTSVDVSGCGIASLPSTSTRAAKQDPQVKVDRSSGTWNSDQLGRK